MKSRLLVLALMTGLLLAAVPAVKAQAEPIIVAVFLMESQGSGLSADEVGNLTDYLATLLGQGGQLQIIPRDEIKKRLLQAKSESHKDCYDTNCQIQLGRELAAQYSISTKIGRVGKQCLITAQVFDLKSSTMIKAVPMRGACDTDTLIDSVTNLSLKIKQALTDQSEGNAPVVEPDPIVEEPIVERPDTLPPPVVKERPVVKAVAGDKLPRFFVGAGIGVTNMSWMDSDGDADTFAGLAAYLDWRIGKGFMLGFALDLEFLDKDLGYAGSTLIGYFDLLLRLGYLIPVANNKVLLHPYGSFGVASLVDMDSDEADPWTGVALGAGFGVRWMLLSWLGLSADLGIEYAEWIPPNDDIDTEGSLNVKFQIGANFAF